MAEKSNLVVRPHKAALQRSLGFVPIHKPNDGRCFIERANYVELVAIGKVHGSWIP